jgi:TfoX/Sxy family transcriptional regulator of competence genes
MNATSDLAARIEKILKRKKGVAEKKMFGGHCFLLNGNMCCGIVKDRLVLRLGEDGAAAALDEPHTAPMDFTGRPMKSMVYVLPKGYATDDELRAWIAKAAKFAASLPAK